MQDKASLMIKPHNGLSLTAPATSRLIEVIMKIRELAQHWEENAKGRLTQTGYTIHLDLSLIHI